MKTKPDFSLCLLLTLFLFTATSFFHKILGQNSVSSNPFELRINCGGEAAMHNSKVFQKDSYFSSTRMGFSNYKIQDIKNTTEKDIYLTESSSIANLVGFSYNIPLKNGKYEVVLHFAEIYWGATGGGPNGQGRRIFDVEIENQSALQSFDLVKEVGTMAAHSHIHNAQVSDGVLNIDFSASVDRPKISAIEILEVLPIEEKDLIMAINSGGGSLKYNTITYQSDDFFHGDSKAFGNNYISNILNTSFDSLYKTERSTNSSESEFEYNIPLSNGNYEIKLHFAEIYWGATRGGSAGANKRVFSVDLEDQTVLSNFDINKEVGSMTATIKSFDATINDGELNLRLYSSIDQPKLSGIEIYRKHQENEPEELSLLSRINSGGGSVTFQDITFDSDKYFKGEGKVFANTSISKIENTNLDEIYKSERSTLDDLGTFSYEIPVTNGNYKVNLHFSEIYFGATKGGKGETGARVFDVSLEGEPILSNFDIYKETGAMSAIVETFSTKVSDGILNIDFSASVNQPKLSALEIFGDGEIIENNQPCEWNDLANSSFERLESQSAVVNNKLYVFSGFIKGLKITNATEIYNPASNTWSLGTPIPEPVTHMGIAVAGDDIWILAGFKGDHPGTAINRVQIYNTKTNSWRYGPSLPYSRGSGTAVYVNNRIHFFGGLKPDRQTDVGEHFYLNLNNLSSGWQSAAQLPNPRNHLSSAVIDNMIYAIGGQYGHDSGADDQKFLHAYNFSTNSWVRKADLPTDRSHFEPGTIVHNNKIIIAGGRNGSFFFDDILQYDPASNSWSDLCKLPNALLAPVAKVIDDKLIIANGGINGVSTPIRNTRWIPMESSDNISSKTISEKSKIESEKLLIYPNPFNNSFNIQLSNSSSAIKQVELFEIATGKLIKTINATKSQVENVSLEGPGGIYLVKITLSNGEEFIEKLVKL